MECSCGFKFSGAGEFRNCPAFITYNGKSGVVCPKCGNSYINGVLVNSEEIDESDEILEMEGE